MVLDALGKAPLITANLHLGEGTGAVASIPLWICSGRLPRLLFLCGGRHCAVHPTMLTLVIGGAASGKSAYAEHLAVQSGGPRYYLATMQVWDAECAARVAKHRAMRAQKQFATVECPKTCTWSACRSRAPPCWKIGQLGRQ
mgnify:CR=1 FL=1